MKKYIWFSSLAVILISCSEKTDEQYLKLEKTELQERLESNTVLFYKLFKIMLRAKDAKNIPPAPHLAKVSNELLEAIDTTHDHSIDVSVQDMALAYKEYNTLRDFALTTNEDTFPTVLETFFMQGTNPTHPAGFASTFGWDNNLEHMALSTVATSARRTEPALYESSMLNTDGEKEAERRCLYRLQKGLVFIAESFPYLSEQEFTKNHQWIESEGKTYSYTFFRSLFPTANATPTTAYHSVHGINLIGRGLSRIKMDRESKTDLALADFEGFLQDAKTIGLDDELVWLVTTYIALERGDNLTAIENLKKLEKSPLFSAADKEVLHAGIDYLQAKEAAKASNLISDKVFMVKMCVQYFAVQLKKIDWEKQAGSHPEVKTLLTYHEKVQQQIEKAQTMANVDNLKEQGSSLLEKAKKAVQ